MNVLTEADFRARLLTGLSVLDVRAPVEFAQGALPYSVNLPILNDKERATVGTCYKQQGREKAIRLGHKIVSGENKEDKLRLWKLHIGKFPATVLTCFRGGLRSQITQQFLAEAGYEVPRIEKGYKHLRQFLQTELIDYSKRRTCRILTGNTGSGKTRLLREVSDFYPVVDLEGLAQHRGSAFGRMVEKQMAQATFENFLSCEIIKIGNGPVAGRSVLLEDESRVIGSLHLPEYFFDWMRQSPVVVVKVSLEERVANILEEYVSEPLMAGREAGKVFGAFLASIAKISTKLGGLRTTELSRDIQKAQEFFLMDRTLELNKVWIEKLLVWYYDPMYVSSLAKRNPKIEMAGTRDEIRDYLKTFP